MWASATRSDARRRAGALSRAALLLLAACAATGHAAGLPAPDQAAAEAFPGASLQRRTWALDDAEMARVEAMAGSRPGSKLVAGFVADRGGAPAGVALLDAHVVRTKSETLLVSMTPARVVSRVDILAFAEPQEYLSPARWREQFAGRSLGPELELKREIRGLTGATLSARAATAATRRCLAIAEVLAARGALPGAAPPGPTLAAAAPVPRTP